MSLSARAVAGRRRLYRALAAGAGLQRRRSSVSSTEYEEDLYLSLDGSADAHRERVDPGARRAARARSRSRPGDPARLERIRAAYQSPVTEVTRVSPPVAPGRTAVRAGAARRQGYPEAERGRAILVVSLRAHGAERASRLRAEGRRLGAAAWDASERWLEGSEIVAFRLHLPAGSSGTTRAISTRNQPTQPRAATSSRGNSTSPTGSRARLSTSRSRWTASRSCIARCGCLPAPLPPRSRCSPCSSGSR